MLKDAVRDVSSIHVAAHVEQLEATDLSAEGRRSTKGRKYGPKMDKHWRRASRKRTTEASYFFQCVPEGHRPTKEPLTWRAAVREALAEQRRRPAFRASVEACLKVYINAQTPQLFTTSPLWTQKSLTPYGIKRATWGRVWRWLIDSKLLGWVAYGRQAEFKPKKQQAEGNDKGVYIFTVPCQDSPADPVATGSVDESETIPPLGKSFSSHPSHAHTYTTHEDGAPRRLKSTSGGSAALTSRLLPALPTIWRTDTTAKASNRKADRVAGQVHFARTLKHFVPALNTERITDRHLAAVLRKGGFFAKGWTVGDIIYCLDRRPDGSPWNHDGATGVGNLAKWLAYRLEPWRDEHGWPLQSPSQRQRTEQAEARVRRYQEQTRIAEQEAAREKSLVSGAFAQGIALLRQALGKVSHK